MAKTKKEAPVVEETPVKKPAKKKAAKAKAPIEAPKEPTVEELPAVPPGTHPVVEEPKDDSVYGEYVAPEFKGEVLYGPEEIEGSIQTITEKDIPVDPEVENGTVPVSDIPEGENSTLRLDFPDLTVTTTEEGQDEKIEEAKKSWEASAPEPLYETSNFAELKKVLGRKQTLLGTIFVGIKK